MKTLVPGNTGSCLEIASELVELYNSALYQVLQELGSQLKGFRYSVHDYYNSLLERINDPLRYGKPSDLTVMFKISNSVLTYNLVMK